MGLALASWQISSWLDLACWNNSVLRPSGRCQNGVALLELLRLGFYHFGKTASIHWCSKLDRRYIESLLGDIWVDPSPLSWVIGKAQQLHEQLVIFWFRQVGLHEFEGLLGSVELRLVSWLVRQLPLSCFHHFRKISVLLLVVDEDLSSRVENGDSDVLPYMYTRPRSYFARCSILTSFSPSCPFVSRNRALVVVSCTNLKYTRNSL